ncbi:MAG: hypothetical protein QOD94_3147 [Alphaproteobacteria bacterium]|nr:hypothetical protein [Alphaproteobacteria bacterium]
MDGFDRRRRRVGACVMPCGSTRKHWSFLPVTCERKAGTTEILSRDSEDLIGCIQRR